MWVCGFVCADDTHAITQLEFQQLHHKLKAERSRSQICHALQMVLNCPVELQISLLGRPPTLNTNDSTIARLVVGNYSAHLSTTSVLKDMKLKGMAVENSSTGQMMFSSHNDHNLHPRQAWSLLNKKLHIPLPGCKRLSIPRAKGPGQQAVADLGVRRTW